ncbi:gp16 family protein [Ferrimonas sp.]|uniref:gp16 family protein n=1 Tax=Ferrimonas sp. TaxID=2080861 RepID=UPI003A8DDE14
MDRKKQLVRLIHVAKRELAMDEHDYRANLMQATGKSSCSQMTLPELEQALEVFKGLGFKPRSRSSKGQGKRLSPKTGHSRSPQVDKVRALWIAMAKHGVVQDGSETALDAYVRRITERGNGPKVDHVGWLRHHQAMQILEMLKSWHRRVLIERIQQRGEAVYTNERSTGLARYDVIVKQYEGAL